MGGVSQSGAADLDDAANEEDVGGAVEILQPDEIDQEVQSATAARRKKPLKRTAFKSRKMLGNAAYRGRDRIRPVDKCFLTVTVFLIVIPSLPALTFT